VPVPDTPIVILALEAFEVTVTFPFALPVVVGAKVALKVALCPAASVIGEAMPLKVNPVPLIAIWEMLTLALPELVTIPERD